MNYKEIRDAALQRIFGYSSGGTVTESRINQDYLMMMPAAANVALYDLAKLSPIRRKLTVRQYAYENLAKADNSGQVQAITGSGVQSFYCEMAGSGTVHFDFVQSDGSTVRLSSVQVSNAAFAPLRYQYAMPSRAIATVTGGAVWQNCAFYAESFSASDEIPSPGAYQHYSVSALVAGQGALPFCRWDDRPVRFSGLDISAVTRFDGTDRISIPSEYEGEIELWYQAYPIRITGDTADDHEVELAPEAAQLIPLYVASAVYAEDDAVLCRQYRDEYERRKADLSYGGDTLAADGFTSVSGW